MRQDATSKHKPAAENKLILLEWKTSSVDDDDPKDLRFTQSRDIEFAGYYDKKQEYPKEKLVDDIRVSAARQWKLKVCLFSLHVPTHGTNFNQQRISEFTNNYHKCRIRFRWKSWWRWRIRAGMKYSFVSCLVQSFIRSCSKQTMTKDWTPSEVVK